MVTVSEVVKVLEDTRARAHPVSRKDYCTRTMVEFVATPNSQIYTKDPLREAVLSPLDAVKPVAVLPPQPMASAPVSKPSSANALTVKGVMSGRVLKKDSLRKNTKMSAELLNTLRGAGPWCASDIIDHLVANDERLSSANQCLSNEVTQLRQDLQRLRDDMTRYREDASRLGDELRTLREGQNTHNYAAPDTRRYDDGYRAPSAARGYLDPYERNYGYDRRY